MTTIRIADLEGEPTARFWHAAEILRDCGGGRFALEDDDYLLTESVVFEGDNIRITGNGRASKIVNGTSDQPALLLAEGSGCAVERLSFAQAGGVAPKAGNRGLLARNLGKSLFERLEATPYPAPLHDAFHFENVSQSAIDHVGASDVLRDGFTAMRCLDIDGHAARADANGGCGFRWIDCEGIQLHAWKAYGNRAAWDIDGFHFFLTSCVGDTSLEDNWTIGRTFDVHFTACWGSAHRDDANPRARGFAIGPKARSIRFVSGGSLACNGDGVAILGAADDVQFSLFSFGSPVPAGRGNGKGGRGYGLNVHDKATNVLAYGGQARGNASGPMRGPVIARDVLT